MKEKGKETSKGSLRNLMEGKDSERMDWIVRRRREWNKPEEGRERKDERIF